MGTSSSLAISRPGHSLAAFCRAGFRTLPARGMLWCPSSFHGLCASTQACLAFGIYGRRHRGQRARHVLQRGSVAVSQVCANATVAAFSTLSAGSRGDTVIKALSSQQQPSIYACVPGDSSQVVAVGVSCCGYSGETDTKASPAQSQPYAFGSVSALCQVSSDYAYGHQGITESFGLFAASTQRVVIDYISVILWHC